MAGSGVAHLDTQGALMTAQDIVKTYDLHANCYITKPVDLDKFVTIVKGLEEFWLSIVKLPSMVTAQAKPSGDR